MLNIRTKIDPSNRRVFVNILKVGIFDLTQDDPLKLSNIVGKAVTNSWTQRDMSKYYVLNLKSEYT